MRVESQMPACATIHPDRKKTMTPRMLIKQEVKTPSQVPNKVGGLKKKLECHHGFVLCEKRWPGPTNYRRHKERKGISR